jgi:hypothetical protein|tara:strand:- start:150 stop:494 length:345 start_codon:yes stop_codon:yes gene_type:complete
MATVIEGQSSSVGQIVKKVTSDSTSVTGPEFELFHKKEVTVAIRNVSGPNISAIKLMRIFSDGVASQESISSDAVAAGNGVTFAVSYNIPKFRIDYTVASSSAGVVLIEVEGGY